MNSRAFAAAVVVLTVVAAGCSRSPAQREAAFLNRGKRLLEKEPSRAVLDFRSAVAAMPQDAEPHYQLGLAYLALNDAAAAVRELRKAIDIDPKHGAARLRLADLMARSSSRTMVEDAESRLGALLSETPGSSDILSSLAIAEARLGKVDDAQRHIEEALTKAPAELRSSILLARLRLSQHDPPGAEQALLKAVEQAPKSVDACLALASFYLGQQRTADAEAQIRRALGLDPKSGPALHSLAAVQIRKGDHAGAEKTYAELSRLPDAHYRTFYGIYLFQQGKRDAAAAEFERLAKADPADRSVRSRLVATYVALNRIADAEKILAAALKKHPNDADALFQRGALFLSQGKLREAEDDLLQVVRLNDSAGARYVLSKVHAARGSSVEQRKQLNEALRIDPALLSARVELSRMEIAAGRAASAIELVNRAPAGQAGLLPARVARIQALLAAGDHAAARKAIDEALAIGRAPEILFEDAALKMEQKNYQGARSSVEEILKTRPQAVAAWRALARTYAAENRLAAAEDRIRQAAAQRPDPPALNLILAEVLLAEGKSGEARTVLTAAAANPELPGANLILALLDQREGAMDQARKRLTDLLSRNAGFVPAILLLGDLENGAGNRSAAISRYRAALDRAPENPIALNNLAYLLAPDQGEEALAYAQKAAQLMPGNAAIEDTLGWIYYRQRRYQVAVDHLNKAVESGNKPLHKYHLALALLKSGDKQRGQRTLQEALTADPGLPKKETEW